MTSTSQRMLVVLGPTASGKTRLGVFLARALNGEIISADSRQVYRGLDLGSGKDLTEYSTGGDPVLYHLIDIVNLDEEFHAFAFQQRCFDAAEAIWKRGRLPVITGGTGLYLDAVLRGYRMVEAPENPVLREELNRLDMAALEARLREVQPHLHNKTDLEDRVRMIRAIEIAEYTREHPAPPLPAFDAFIIGTRWPRAELRQRIAQRLHERIQAGMIDEVGGLLARGVSWERLDSLGLEYRYITQFLRGRLPSVRTLEEQLAMAIGQFAKRQETWFRRMERLGVVIHWVDRADPKQALELMHRHWKTS